MPILSPPTGVGKTTADLALIAEDLDTLVIGVLPNAVPCESTAAFMSSSKVSTEKGGAVAFVAQTAYCHPD